MSLNFGRVFYSRPSGSQLQRGAHGGHRGDLPTRGQAGLASASHVSEELNADRSTRGWGTRGHGRGGGRGGSNRVNSPKAPRPTHFLALPLHCHATLRTRVASFQSSLLQQSPPISGLDPSILIDPRRLHLTLGVMALEDEDQNFATQAEVSDGSKRTPKTALALLRSLQPRILELLGDAPGLKVPLEVLDVFPPGATSGANVLYLGPNMTGIDRPRRSTISGVPLSKQQNVRWKERLWNVSDFIHQEFRTAGYITERRPLKLHCTIINTSHRKPRKRLPFSYDDILNSSSRSIIAAPDSLVKDKQSLIVPATEASNSMLTDTRDPGTWGSGPVPVDVGVYDVSDVQLWVMGSHGPNNEYVNLGGIRLH